MTDNDKQRQPKVVQFWHESARRDRATAESLYKLKHYDWSLFVFHLALEKFLKALIVQAGTVPPPTHDLERLAELAQLDLSNEKRDQLNTITGFNIEARYPEEKKALYQQATPEFTQQWHNICQELFLWIEKHLTI